MKGSGRIVQHPGNYDQSVDEENLYKYGNLVGTWDVIFLDSLLAQYDIP